MNRIMILASMMCLLSGCQKMVKHGFQLAPANPCPIDLSILPAAGEPITIFIHGGARPLSSLIPFPGLHSKCPKGLTLATELGSDCVLGKRAGMILSAADPEMFPRKSFFVFGWSGVLSFNSREKAGQQLYDILCQLRADERYAHSKITVVSFSHGGNVALNAGLTACARGDTRELVDLLVMSACPVVSLNKDFIGSSTFKQIISLYSKSDSFQVFDPQGLYPEMSGMPCSHIFSKRRFDEACHLIQAELKINNRSQTGHLGFVSARCLRALPRIIKLLLNPEERAHLPVCKNSSYCVTLNTKEKEVRGCQSLRAWKRERRLEPMMSHAMAGCTSCEQLLQSKKRRSSRKIKARRERPNEQAS